MLLIHLNFLEQIYTYTCKDPASIILKTDIYLHLVISAKYPDVVMFRLLTSFIFKAPVAPTFRLLPNEMIAMIFALLPEKILCETMKVCKHWKYFIEQTPTLWRKLVYVDRDNIHVYDFCRVISRCSCLLKLKIVLAFEEPDLFDILTTNCPLLRMLDLSTNSWRFENCINKIGTRCKNLEVLHLNRTFSLDDSLTALFPIADLPKLKVLNIRYSEWVSSEFIIYLADSKCELEYLNITDVCAIRKEVFIRLMQKKGGTLKHLEIDGAELSNEAFNELSKCTSLNWLSITDASSMNTSFSVFTKLQLERLFLYRAVSVPEATFVDTFESGNMKYLKSLELSKCRNLSDAVLTALAKGAPNLEKLSLSDSFVVDEVGINKLLQACKKLDSLLLCGLPCISLALLRNVVRELPNLKYVNLHGAPNISDADILEVLQEKPNIKIFNAKAKLISLTPVKESWNMGNLRALYDLYDYIPSWY